MCSSTPANSRVRERERLFERQRAGKGLPSDRYIFAATPMLICDRISTIVKSIQRVDWKHLKGYFVHANTMPERLCLAYSSGMR